MPKVRSPLSPTVAAWIDAQGFLLSDWTAMPAVADAVEEGLGPEHRDQVLAHGRWLVLGHVYALCRPLWTMPSDWWNRTGWTAGELGRLARAFCQPRKPIDPQRFDRQARSFLNSLEARRPKARDLFRDPGGRPAHPELIHLKNLLRAFLANAGYRPRQAEPASHVNGTRNSPA
jgi:hypothetical protein